MTESQPSANLIPLTDIRPGTKVRISQVVGGQGLRARLCAMGLTPGVPVEMICCNGGPVVLNVLGGRLMLGHGMAKKLLVRKA